MTKSLPSLDQIDSEDSLVNLQRTFAEIIRNPLSEGDSMQNDPRTDQMIRSNDRTAPHGRLQFYARQYWWRIQGSFDEDFRTVQKLLTKEDYLRLRDEYLVQFPSISYTLRNLGNRFPDFLKNKNKLLADASLYDLSKMKAFESKTIKPLSVPDVESTDFPSETLYLQPHVKLLELDYPVNQLNKSNLVHEDSSASNTLTKKEDSTNNEGISSINKEETFLAIHRLGAKIFSKQLNKEQFQILKKFEQGISLEALENSISEKALSIIQESFSEWMALSWLSLENPNTDPQID